MKHTFFGSGMEGMVMNALFKMASFMAMMLVMLVVVIKVVTGSSWRDAVGVLEEFCKEMKGSCGCGTAG